MTTPAQNDFETLSKRDEAKLVEDYLSFLRFPSISTDPNHKQDIENCYQWLAKKVEGLGFKIERFETCGHPTLFGEVRSENPQAPTLLIYNHYDVQPVDPLEEWEHPPFEPYVNETGEVYARGAQDNKGQCMAVYAALKWLLEKNPSPPCHIKWLIEGEEECGSAGLAGILEEKKEKLQADHILIVDVGLPDANTPAVTLGTRGMVALTVSLNTANSDLHSGLHGGIALNPLQVLTKLLASLYDESGHVIIPNFYKDIKELSREEKELLDFSFDEQAYIKSSGASPTGGERNLPPLERNWLRPSLEINGIQGGYAGAGIKTVIPKRAIAKLSCRTAAGQNPKQLGLYIKHYLELYCPKAAHLHCEVHEGTGGAVLTSPQSKLAQSMAQAYEAEFQKPCKNILSGASIPIAADLAKTSGADVVLIGMGLDEDHIHAPNEHFGIARLFSCARIVAQGIETLGT